MEQSVEQLSNETRSNDANTETLMPNSVEHNRTDVIYSVFIQNIPIHSLIALEDIKLLTNDEINTIFEEKIYRKTEGKEEIATDQRNE